MKFPFVVGIGSYHGDDQAGWLVIEQLRERCYPRARLMQLQHPADLLDVAGNETSLVICDACMGAGTPGSIHQFHWPQESICYQRASGSHDLPLGSVMELGRQLDCVPETADIWVLEGEIWSAGMDPSDVVRSAAVRLADHLWKSYCHA